MNIAQKIKNKISYLIAGALSQNTNKTVNGEKKADENVAKYARTAAAEGIVLLRNDGTLPLTQEDNVAVFGRVQNNYFLVGYGSGGDVNPPYKVNLMQGLKNNGRINYNKKLADIYSVWCQANPTNEGFWGHWPFYYEEMPLTDDIIDNARRESNKAIVVIGRAAGEDRENKLEQGSFYLTDGEKKMLDAVTERFEKTVVILDCGNIIDCGWIDSYGEKIGSVVYAWQGGMEAGNALADVLSGDVTPSGKLTDTIAGEYADYPSSDNFGRKAYNNYAEDIYVGYRYFNTFCPEKVLFPFGYGLSYTDFEITPSAFCYDGKLIGFSVTVTNRGDRYCGKEVVQVYVGAPQGKLGKPKVALTAFQKTKLLKPGEKEVLNFTIKTEELASFDDSGVTGYPNCYVLEKGEYRFFVGNSSINLLPIGEYTLADSVVTKRLTEALAVEDANVFERIKPAFGEGEYKIAKELTPSRKVNLKERILSELPEEISMTEDKGYTLSDVRSGKVTMDDFVAQLSVDDLENLTHGDIIMNSPLGALGNAGVFGGITARLRNMGIPPVTASDGPSGIRLLQYTSLLPCGTALASTMNTELVYSLTQAVAEEMIRLHSDVLLAPGMNIHRDPLCGRNFEYFSEDPYICGEIATAFVKGIQSKGVAACPKHFACNNQETNRSLNDSRVSPRALREIYLKGFETVVKNASPKTLMTAYNRINGVGCHYNYELCETILRQEWGYKGMVMTDWWVTAEKSKEFDGIYNGGYRVRARVDVAMPGSKNAISGKYDGSVKKSMKRGKLTVGELQRAAKDVLNFIIDSKVFAEKSLGKN